MPRFEAHLRDNYYIKAGEKQGRRYGRAETKRGKWKRQREEANDGLRNGDRAGEREREGGLGVAEGVMEEVIRVAADFRKTSIAHFL